VEWLRAHPEQQNPNPQVDAMCDGIISAWRIHLTQEALQPDSDPSR
jgi:hypothetical protein